MSVVSTAMFVVSILVNVESVIVVRPNAGVRKTTLEITGFIFYRLTEI